MGEMALQAHLLEASNLVNTLIYYYYEHITYRPGIVEFHFQKNDYVIPVYNRKFYAAWIVV